MLTHNQRPLRETNLVNNLEHGGIKRHLNDTKCVKKMIYHLYHNKNKCYSFTLAVKANLPHAYDH